MAASEPISRYVSLLQDEKVLMTLRRRYPSVFTSILSFAATSLSVALGSVARYIVQYSGYLEALWYFFYAVIAAIAFIFILIALVGYFYVQGHFYILTNRRIILFRKFVTISVRELAYSEITDIIVNQGPIARLLNYGSITPLSPGVRGFYALPYPYVRRGALPRVELKDVSNPFGVISEVFKLARSIL